jgi:hypothetical protein
MHNISQADIIAAETDEQKFKRCASLDSAHLPVCSLMFFSSAGQSTVEITHVDPEKKVLYSAWIDIISKALCLFFPCKSYSVKSDYVIAHIFYGLADQTAATAQSFEMVHNLIQTWSIDRKDIVGRSAKKCV